MKKTTVFSMMISLIINGICTLMNYIYALSFGFLPLQIASFPGGEFMEYSGFGIRLQIIYSFGTIEEASTTSIISFDLLGFLIPFILLFVMIFALKTAYNIYAKNKS